MKRLLFICWWAATLIVGAQTPYRADIKTVVSSTDSAVLSRLFLDAARTPAPLGSRLWFVADRDGNGVPTSPSPGSILGADDVLLLADAVDGSLLGSQVGRFVRNGIEVSDRAFSEVDVYVYLWNHSQAGEFVPGAGNTFGLFKLGKVAIPEVGNANWGITGDIFANQYTVSGGGTPTGPALTSQPQSQSVEVGARVAFVVTATGSEPLSYQWTKDNVAIAGATAASLTLESVTLADRGFYRVVVTNVVSGVTSSPAELTVLEPVVPPAIVTQPANQSVDEGGTATFTVVATGTLPLQYQWRKDGVELSGATSATLVINPVTPSDGGQYTVVVTNAADSKTSDPATLTVVPVAELRLFVETVSEGVLLKWTGGRPPFQVDSKAALGDAAWTPGTQTSERQIVLPTTPAVTFFRVSNP